MDYKKLYNEAKERFKAFKAKYYTRDTYIGDVILDRTGKMQKDFESIFPELKESEDERIRKEIINYILYKASSISAEQEHAWISYLEKQKEQKPTGWSKNDTVFLNEITDFFENKTGRLQHDLDMYAHWLKSLPERFNPQPKQEWSEEDKLMIKCCLKALEYCKYTGKRGQFMPARFDIGGYLASVEKVENWLKSIRPVSKESLQSWKPSEDEESKK